MTDPTMKAGDIAVIIELMLSQNSACPFQGQWMICTAALKISERLLWALSGNCQAELERPLF